MIIIIVVIDADLLCSAGLLHSKKTVFFFFFFNPTVGVQILGHCVGFFPPKKGWVIFNIVNIIK